MGCVCARRSSGNGGSHTARNCVIGRRRFSSDDTSLWSLLGDTALAERLRNKVAIVTGSGRGIGAAIAHSFVAEGAAVVIAERDGELAASVERSLSALGGRVLSVVTDITQDDQVEQMVRKTTEEFGLPHVLVNNAGINIFSDPLELTNTDWERCLAVDLEGAWKCCRAVLPLLVKNRAGSIINMASCHSQQVIRGCFPYAVAKHGLLGLTRSLAIEYAEYNIRVNAIAPGYIETQLARDYWNTFPDPEKMRLRTAELHPPRRLGQPVEVAMTAVFLASDEAPFINGAVIPIDGGRSVLYHD